MLNLSFVKIYRNRLKFSLKWSITRKYIYTHIGSSLLRSKIMSQIEGASGAQKGNTVYTPNHKKMPPIPDPSEPLISVTPESIFELEPPPVSCPPDGSLFS